MSFKKQEKNSHPIRKPGEEKLEEKTEFLKKKEDKKVGNESPNFWAEPFRAHCAPGHNTLRI